MKLFLVILAVHLFFLTTNSETYNCQNLSEILKVFFNTPIDRSNRYVRTFTEGRDISIAYPNETCYQEIWRAIYMIAIRSEEDKTRFFGDQSQCCLDINTLRNNLQAYKSRIDKMDIDVSDLEKHCNKVNLEIYSLDKRFNSTLSSLSLSIGDINKNLNSAGLARTEIIKLLRLQTVNQQDHENRLSMIENTIVNTTYKDSYSDKDTNTYIQAVEGMAKDPDEEKEEETTVKKCLAGSFLSLILMYKPLAKDMSMNDCLLLQAISYFTITFTVLFTLIIIFVYKMIISFFLYAILRKIQRKINIDKSVHSLMKRARKTGNMKPIQELIGKLQMHQLQNVQFSFQLSRVIPHISKGWDVYYVVIVMSLEMSVDHSKNILQRIFRSIRYSDDYYNYFLAFGFFQNFDSPNNDIEDIVKISINKQQEDNSDFSMVTDWVVPTYGRIYNFLKTLTDVLDQVTVNKDFAAKAILNIRSGSLPDRFLTAYSQNDKLDFYCEGAIIFKNAVAEKFIFLADISELPLLLSIHIGNTEKYTTRKKKGNKRITFSSASAPLLEDSMTSV